MSRHETRLVAVPSALLKGAARKLSEIGGSREGERLTEGFRELAQERVAREECDRAYRSYIAAGGKVISFPYCAPQPTSPPTRWIKRLKALARMAGTGTDRVPIPPPWLTQPQKKTFTRNANKLATALLAAGLNGAQKRAFNHIWESPSQISAAEVYERLVKAFRDDAQERAYYRAKAAHIRREACYDLLSYRADGANTIHVPRPGPHFRIVVRLDGECRLRAVAPTPIYVEGGWQMRGSGLHYKAGRWVGGGTRQEPNFPDVETPEEPDDEAGEEDTYTSQKSASLGYVDQGGAVIAPFAMEVDALFDDTGQDDADFLGLAFEHRGYNARSMPGHQRRPVLGSPNFAPAARRWLHDMRMRPHHMWSKPPGDSERSAEIMSTAAGLWLEENDPKLRERGENVLTIERLAERWLRKTIRRVAGQRWFWESLRADYAQLRPADHVRHAEARTHEALSWISETDDDPIIERARQVFWCFLRSAQSQASFAKANGLHRTELRRHIDRFCEAVAARPKAPPRTQAIPATSEYRAKPVWLTGPSGPWSFFCPDLNDANETPACVTSLEIPNVTNDQLAR